jgi:hypothetical protein
MEAEMVPRRGRRAQAEVAQIRATPDVLRRSAASAHIPGLPSDLIQGWSPVADKE